MKKKLIWQKSDLLNNKNLYPNSSLKIYNAKGQIIYETNDYQNNWQGFVSAGVYLIRWSYVNNKGMMIIEEVKLVVVK